MKKHATEFSFLCVQRIAEFNNINTVEPRYLDTLWTKKKCRHKRSVAAAGVGETYVYKKQYFL